MPLRRRMADAVRRRLVPSAAELDELRERVRVRETELAESRQRIRSLERQLDELQSGQPKVSDQARATPEAAPEAQAPAVQESPVEAAPAAGVLLIVEEECVGCGTCVDLAPDAFQMDRARAIAEVVSQGAPADQVEEAILACPTQCIQRSEH